MIYLSRKVQIVCSYYKLIIGAVCMFGSPLALSINTVITLLLPWLVAQCSVQASVDGIPNATVCVDDI